MCSASSTALTEQSECMEVQTPAYSAYVCPNVARIAVFDNDLDSPYHRPGTESIGDDTVFYIGFHAEVALDSRNRVYNNSFSHNSNFYRLSLSFSSL